MDINVINKDNLPTASIKDFKPLQGKLKTLSDKNYNKLKKSIEHYGFFVPIFVWNGYIMDGHGRREVIIGEGWNIKVPYINIEAKDVDEAKDKLLHITSQYNTITIEGLQEFNPNWGELSINFDAISISKEEPKLEAKEDDFDTTPPSEPKTVLGDLYEIGEHRLLCGDSTDSDQVEKLMDGEKADMVFTDPPYGVDYQGGVIHGNKINVNHKRDKLQNDAVDIYSDFINLLPLVIENGALYIFYATRNSYEIFKPLKENGIPVMAVLAWVKINTGYADMNSHYKNRYEPCVYCKIGNSTNFVGATSENTTWEIEKDRDNKLHPTQKPITVPYRAIKNHTANIVADLFLGSGSTMVASHQLKRKCYGMELDPKYCDVIVTRMLKLDPSLTIKRNGEVIEW